MSAEIELRMLESSVFQNVGTAMLKPREAKVVRTRGTDRRLGLADAENVWECDNWAENVDKQAEKRWKCCTSVRQVWIQCVDQLGANADPREYQMSIYSKTNLYTTPKSKSRKLVTQQTTTGDNFLKNDNLFGVEGKGFILCKAGSHSIEELIPLRYPWARDYNLRLHTSLLGGLVLNRDSLLPPHVVLLILSTTMDEGLSRPWWDLNQGTFNPKLSTLPTELSHHVLFGVTTR